ncbi:unnamed protein product [Lactuca saligna]|uniref:Embryonic flower 1 n=1 Tax=Lactuca saligna TaxID=75948 RepID=A0AA36EBT6_LACSI|nr:unnamed protein product [Lactuca saligna]
MDSDTDKRIRQRDSGTIIGGDQAQGSNVNALLHSSSSTVKINSLSINLGIVKGKDDPQKCNHFSIRGYVAKMREKGDNHHLPFSDGIGEEPPPIEVPRFRYWLCQICLQDYGGGSTSQEVALVSQYGKSMMQPCTTSYSSSPNCHGLPMLPFGEGTSGHKPVDERISVDESIIQEDTTQSSPDHNLPDTEEPKKIDSIDASITEYAAVVDDSKKLDLVNEPLTSPPVQSTESDQQNQDPTGHPRRKARKVRLLTELLCGSNEKQHQRKESTNLPELTPTPSSPLKKRKIPQAQEWKPVEGHVGKKVKVVKENVSGKTSIVNEGEGGQKTDKYQCTKHGVQKSSKLVKATSDPVAAWRSIFSDMGRSDKHVSLPNDASRPSQDVYEYEGKRNVDQFSEKRCNASKKVMEDPMRNQLFGDDHIQRSNVGDYDYDSRARGGQSETGLGLGLSLNYEPQSRVSWLPPLPNRVPIQDHSRKDGFFFGESSIGHKGVSLDPQAKGRSVYSVRDGHTHTPRTPFLQEQQPFHTHLSHGSFSQHQNLDFSDPHNKRNNGVRGYADIMMANSHQRHDIFSNGRSDEREIVELMAKIQYERNLSESRNYNSSNFHKVSSFNQGMPIPHHQYPTFRRPSMENSGLGPTTMRNPNPNPNPSGFFHQEPIPAFPSFDTFSHQSNGIRVSDNSYYHESRENNRIPHHHSSVPTNMQIMNKGKNVMNLDLNVMAPNVHEEQNNNNNNTGGSLDHSYSNEAIPAMQLLSLMDAGKKSSSSSSSPFMDKKKLTPKPQFSSYNGKQNSFIIPCSGMLQSSVQRPVENSRSFITGRGASFSSFFHTDQTHGGQAQFVHKPQEKKQRGVSMASGSVSGHNKYRQEDSYGFPLPWHASEGGLGTRNVTSGTEICTVNQNPADFSTPGPENVYMIDFENLKFRGDRVYYPREGTV